MGIVDGRSSQWANGSEQNDWRERIRGLEERHEALTQAVEIIAGMQRKNEVLMAQTLEAINSLARIAQSHERRLDDLEGPR